MTTPRKSRKIPAAIERSAMAPAAGVSPKAVLLPYQAAWVNDSARFKIGLWSRQSGKSFMNAAQLAARNEMDRDILYFVREMQRTAPVTAENIHSFLVGVRRRKCHSTETEDRLAYLVDAAYLKRNKTWSAGMFMHEYEITATGMDLLDGAIPPRNPQAG